MYSIVDGELQCHCILTTLCIGSNIIIVTACSISKSCTCCPGIGCTGGLWLCGMNSIVDGELQCHCILTTLCIGSNIIIVTACSISKSCSCCPGIGCTGSLWLCGMNSIVDGELQCHCILTTLCIGSNIIIVTACSISKSCTCCPCIGCTGSLWLCGMNSVVDGELQCYCILTTLCIGSNIIIVTAGGISKSCTCCPCKGCTGGLRLCG